MSTIGAIAHDIQYSEPVDEIAAALAFHDGDVRATIGTLIEDCRHLRTRGWTPSFERDAIRRRD
ncbi:hypothetical protein LJR255_002344 [Pararhizobium sp. LjRoot255]|uniref:hypothetical protein n=1 Tax=Pararhizobium sp. LjRoot255 TaxID=3342298 RepID=UPI003ECE8D31